MRGFHFGGVRDVDPIKPKAAPKGAPSLTAEQLRGLLADVRSSDYCNEHDLADPITLYIATGFRRSELLALQWTDFDQDAGTLTVTAKLIRATGYGLQCIDETKTTAGMRTVPLPKFAIEMLKARRSREFYGQHMIVFPSTAGAWRDPNNFGAHGPRGSRRGRGHQSFVPQGVGHPD